MRGENCTLSMLKYMPDLYNNNPIFTIKTKANHILFTYQNSFFTLMNWKETSFRRQITVKLSS
jgi:hypothetical protein